MIDKRKLWLHGQGAGVYREVADGLAVEEAAVDLGWSVERVKAVCVAHRLPYYSSETGDWHNNEPYPDDPTPEEIAAACERIRATWSERDRKIRAGEDLYAQGDPQAIAAKKKSAYNKWYSEKKKAEDPDWLKKKHQAERERYAERRKEWSEHG